MRHRKSIVKRDSALFAAACDALLDHGAGIRFRANGRSMRPNILDDDVVVVSPSAAEELRRGDIAFTRTRDGIRVHRVRVAAHSADALITRADAGEENDAATSAVLGKVIAVERHGRTRSLVFPGQKYFHAFRRLAFQFAQAAALRAARLRSVSAFFALALALGILFSASPAAAQSFTLTDVAAPTTVAPGGAITYTQTLTSGNKAVNANIVLSQPLPANTTFVSMTPSGGAAAAFTCAYNSGTGVASCIATTAYPKSTTTTFTLIVTVISTTSNGTIIGDTVTVTSGNAPTVNASANVTVETPDLSVTDAAAPTIVSDGGNITFTQVVTNNSATVGAVGASVSESTPANTTFQTITAPAGWTCPTQPAAGGTGSIVCNATGTFAGSGSATFTLLVQVGAAVTSGTVISNSVTVSETGTDANPANNTASVNLTVQVPDLSITDAATPSPVATGANITYTQVVTNNSTTAAASGATLSETTPANTNFVSMTAPGGWTCGTQPAAGGRGSIVCTATGSFAASGTATFTLVAAVSPEAVVGSNITSNVTVSETGADPNLANNTATATVAVQGADLSMTQTASAAAVAPGTVITYTETVTNNGPNAATGATLYQQTPPNTTFASMVPPAGWTCGTLPVVGGTGQVICTATGSMAANTTTGNFLYVVTVGAGTAAGTLITNQADVTSETTDGNSANNGTITSVLVELTPDADLAISMTALPTPVFISSAITYTIQVSNLGLAIATGVTVTDNLPTVGAASVLTNVTASSTQGACTVGLATVSCNIGTVTYPLLTPITISISGTTPATPMTLSNSASVATTGTDPVSSNNSSTVLTVVQPLVCATPAKDGSPGTLTGVINAYYPPAAPGAVAAGSTTIALGPAAGGGAATNISAGDLLLVMQMQAAQINSTNTSSYGSGIPGDPSGATSFGNTGVFEFVTARNSVASGTGGTLNLVGTGANNGLLNSYASAAATPTQGVQTFQVIRVPQYGAATLSSSLTAMRWNGATGGVLVVDVAAQLTLGGSVVLDGFGFRGAGGIDLVGSPTGTNTDTVTTSPATLPALPPPAGSGANAGKGEGIAGAPHWIAPALSTIAHTTTAASTGQAIAEGYPNGSFARGAPGNAGGGATDANVAANDQNSGGGGGANGGPGGTGGFGWNSAGLVGGYGGAPFPATTSALVMGGGGGAGTTNNGSYWDPSTDTGNNNCGASCTGIYSSGVAGGGMVIIHAGSVVGTGTISANGQTALEPENDGGGGAGAGGTIVVFANSGGLAGLTASASGGSGGDTWPEQVPGATFPGNRHGAGGGGGGGVIFTTSAPGSASVAGGGPGWSTLANDPYGATPGQAGVLSTGLSITETPGTQSGAYCAGADLVVTNSGTPNPVLPGPGPGNIITYTQTVANNGPLDALNATFSETVPANTTFQSLGFPGGSGWTCTAPAVGLTGAISCTNPDVASGASTTFTAGVAVNPGVAAGTVITDIVNATAGTNDPNLTNNSAIVQTTVGSATTADLAITNVASPNPVVAGSNLTYTVVVKNNGVAAASTVAFTDAIPANTAFVSVTPTPATGWTCGVTAGTLTCSDPSVASGASTSFALVVTVNSGTAAGTVITDTAQVSSPTTDPNPNNNSATVTDVVATATQSDLSITSTASPANVVTDGNNISYTQIVTNNGPAVSGAATFTDTVPAGASFVSMTVPGGWNCGALPAVGSTGGTITCTIAALAVNATASFPLVVQAALGDAPGTTISNTANINVPCASTTDPNCANNSAGTSVIVASPTQADVAITKTASPEPVDQGTNLTYTIQVTNNGPAVATNVVMNDAIPGEVTFGSVSATQGSCTYTAATTTVNCPLGNISVGGLVVITINATANTFSSTALSTNTATVSASTGDPNSANNTSSFTSTIAAPTAVQLASFRAIPRQGGGVLLEWRTREEVRNLGFNIFRIDGSTSARQRLNPSIIAGSALLIRGGSSQHSAKTYQWFDPSGAPQSAYILEDVDLNGTRIQHGPVSVDVSASAAAGAVARPLLLRELSHAILQPAPNNPHLLHVPRPIIPPPSSGENPVALDGDAAVKISVESEGWYQLPKAQLVAAGLDPNADSRFLQLYAEGIEQPIRILGAQSGPLSANDRIEFYGTGVDTPFSGTRVYWLVSGKHPGKRIRSITPAANDRSESQSFPFTVVLEQRTTYFATLLNGDNNDNFFGDAVTSSPVDESLTVAHADRNSSIPVSVDIRLQGATDQQPHRVSVYFNGASIGEMDFANLSNFTQNFAIDPSLLQNGVNAVTLTALNGDNDISVVQSIALRYPHTYEADGNWLRATANSGSTIRASGFSSQKIQALDITDPLNILALNGSITQDGSFYSITLGAPRSAETERTLLLFSDDQISAPAGLAFHPPAALASETAGSQMVIITHPDFAAALPPLVQFHQSQGMSVQVVTIDEVFDAFSYGERSPIAMRSFLQNAASHWSSKPKYLLLVGGASLDPRNYLGLGDFDFVPTRIVETAAFKTASDDWFSDFNETGFATIATGRIPARTLSDAQLVVGKILSFAGSSANSVNAQALLIADQNVGADFTTATKFAASDLPTSLEPVEIFADGQDTSVVTEQIVAALNAGPLLVNYSGHGAEQQWSFEDLLDTSSAAALSNSNQYSVYVLMDCLNGFFHDVYAASLSTSLLLAPHGGAAAVWASSGFTIEPPQASMNQALLEAIKANPSLSLGNAIIIAKSGVSDPDVRRTWIFFGDPAMLLQPSAAAEDRSFDAPVPSRPRPPSRPPHITKSSY